MTIEKPLEEITNQELSNHIKTAKSLRMVVLKGLLAAGIMYLAQGCAAIKNKVMNIEFNTGYNAVEIAYTDNDDIRNRLLTNVDITIGQGQIGYSASNDIDNGDENYFGRHVVLVGKKNAGTQGAAVIKTDDEGVLDAKIGVRNTSLIKKAKGYGFLDFVGEKDAINLTFLYGRGLPKGFSAEVFQVIERPFEGKIWYKTEVQLNKQLWKNLSVFGRAELTNFETKGGVYVGGLSVKF